MPLLRGLLHRPRNRPAAPRPPVHDEPVPPHQQHPLARVIQDHRHRAAPHPEDVLRETHVVRKLDIGQAHADMRGILDQSLAVDHPLMRVSHVRDTTGLPDVPGIYLAWTTDVPGPVDKCE